jgi:hypothetical protein
MSEPATEHSIRNAFRLLVGATCLLFLITVALGAYVFTVAHRNNIVLCAQRHALDVQIGSSEQFLKENPNGIPGISASVIQRGLTNSKRTRKTLDILDC